MKREAQEWLRWNPLEGEVDAWVAVGEAQYKEFCEVTSGEGYRDDVLLDAVRSSLERSFSLVVVESCYFQTTFDWVEAGFLFPELQCEVEGRTWIAGYQHTFHINRRNDIEVHPATLFRSRDGLKMWVDWMEPDVVTRRVSFERILQTGTIPASKASPFLAGHLARLEGAAEASLEDPMASLKACSIPNSAKAGILEHLEGGERATRYRVAVASAQYAAGLPYERAWKYWQTAGRVLAN